MESRIDPARVDRLEEERLAQQAWVLKQPALAPAVEAILRREFLQPQSAADLEGVELQRIVQFAKSEVPHYRESDAWRAITADAPISRELLATMPVLDKTQLRENTASFRAGRLPRGERVSYETKSTGTTGTPVRVPFGQQAGMAFGLLAQRLHRWARFDPLLKQAVIRQARVLPKNPDGSPLQDGQVQYIDGWMYVRDFYRTGPQTSITRSNSTDFQLDWLRKERPAYLMTSPSLLESLVYAAQGNPVDSLKGYRVIAATLTEAVRQQIESATQLGVQQPYGLNEIGGVASRCRAGRYHVNAEHCVVEIVDEKFQPCKPGEFGRVLVTALTNVVMPLLRYDTGDIAEAVTGECACGVTLPAFGRILGRYRPTGSAPEGTMRRLDLVFDALRAQPLPLLANLREYQLHQYLDGHFELRLNTLGEPAAGLIAAVREAWNRQAGDAVLAIIQVPQITRIPGQKTQEFTSDFFPALQAGA